MCFADRVSRTDENGGHLVVKAHAQKSSANVLRGSDWIVGFCHGPLRIDVDQPHLRSDTEKV